MGCSIETAHKNRRLMIVGLILSSSRMSSPFSVGRSPKADGGRARSLRTQLTWVTHESPTAQRCRPRCFGMLPRRRVARRLDRPPWASAPFGAADKVRVTPAMVANVSTRLFDVSDIVALVETAESKKTA